MYTLGTRVNGVEPLTAEIRLYKESPFPLSKAKCGYKATKTSKILNKALASLRKYRFHAAAKHLLNVAKFKSSMEKNVEKLIWKESKMIASPAFQSKFRTKKYESLKAMKLQDLAAELKNNAPFTYSALSAVLKRYFKEDDTKESRVRIAVAFSILINHRNMNMNSIQKLMGILLFKAKARVKVNIVKNLCTIVL